MRGHVIGQRSFRWFDLLFKTGEIKARDLILNLIEIINFQRLRFLGLSDLGLCLRSGDHVNHCQLEILGESIQGKADKIIFVSSSGNPLATFEEEKVLLNANRLIIQSMNSLITQINRFKSTLNSSSSSFSSFRWKSSKYKRIPSIAFNSISFKETAYNHFINTKNLNTRP